MPGKNIIKLLHRTIQPKFSVPKRNFAQVGMIISTPPRVPCSYPEKVAHVFFMYIIWFSPMAYFLTQLKVWRREYIQDQSSD